MAKRKTHRTSGNKQFYRESHETTTTSAGGESQKVRHTTEAGVTAAAPEVGVPLAAGRAAGNAAGTIVVAPVSAVKSHTDSGVLFWGLLLLVFATWKGFWKPTIVDTMWNGQDWNPSIPGRLELGGVVFIVMLAMIADSSDEAAVTMDIMLVAMWLLFIMFNGISTIKAFFNWFQTSGLGVTQVPTSTTTSGTGTSQGNKATGNPNNQSPNPGGNTSGIFNPNGNPTTPRTRGGF